jgi:hypothetical protein
MSNDLDDNGFQMQTSEFAKELMISDQFRRRFETQQAMIKFAVCVALSKNIEPVARDRTFRTAHTISSLDPDQRLRALIRTKYRSGELGRTIEGLAEAGFRFIDNEIKQKQLDISEFFEFAGGVAEI